jgi:flagellar protein FliS
MGFARMDPRTMYRDASARGRVEGADPHQLTGMLFESLVERLNLARGAIDRKDVPAKGTNLSRAQAILAELRDSLNHDVGGSMSKRLDRLYDYMGRRLIDAQLKDDAAAVAEVLRLIQPIHSAWIQIRSGNTGVSTRSAAVAGVR